jgi:hypothetical protein
MPKSPVGPNRFCSFNVWKDARKDKTGLTELTAATEGRFGTCTEQ